MQRPYTVVHPRGQAREDWLRDDGSRGGKKENLGGNKNYGAHLLLAEVYTGRISYILVEVRSGSLDIGGYSSGSAEPHAKQKDNRFAGVVGTGEV